MSAEASASVSLRAAETTLRRGLRSFRWRVRLLLAMRLATVGIAVTAGAAAVVVLILRLRGLWYPMLLPEICLGAVVTAAALAALVWPLPDRSVARSADRRLGLRDRLGSALEFARGGTPSGMDRAAIADAIEYLRSAHARDAYPVRTHRATAAAGICLAALVLSQTLPIPALLLPDREREEKAQLRQEAAKIEPLAKELEEVAKQSGDDEAEEVARRLKKLAQQLERGHLTKKQALLKLQDLESLRRPSRQRRRRPSRWRRRPARASPPKRWRSQTRRRSQETRRRPRS
jgi:DNA segregation ATPase FtsK/SpoIIIE-like protein